jgi:hypothetical protein
MDYAALLDALEKASLFDLWRLNAAIARALEDPRRNEAIRAKLCVGQAVRYFEAKENREIGGRIVEIKRSRALIQHDHDGKLWDIPFYMIHLQGTGLDAQSSRVAGKVRRDSLQVGDLVGYRSREHRDVYGVVVKLNPKTAIVQLPDGQRWKVSYGLLSYVLEAEDAAAARHGALQNMLERMPSSQAPEFSGTEGPE